MPALLFLGDMFVFIIGTVTSYKGNEMSRLLRNKRDKKAEKGKKRQVAVSYATKSVTTKPSVDLQGEYKAR